MRESHAQCVRLGSSGTSLHGYVRLGYQSHASSYWMHGERKFVHFYLFESFSRPFYKTNDAQAYFVDQWDWMHSFNFGNGLKPTRCARGFKLFQS